MEDTEAQLFSFQGPIIYATSALAITVAALVIGYLYTQKFTKDVSKEAVKDGKLTDAHRENQTTNNSDKAKPTKSEKESSVLTGEWPTTAPQEIYAIPEDAPEHLKKILEMGFPGCPVFRRMDQPDKITKISEPPLKPVPDHTLAPIPEVLAIPEDAPEHLKKVMEMGFPGCPVFKLKEDMTLESLASSLGAAAAPVPEVLAIPENAPEHLKRVMEMGFPGCPVFKRKEDMDKPADTDGTKPKIQAEPKTETLSCEGAAAPEVYAIPENCPEHLKKVLEMGFPGCPVFRRADTDQPEPKQEPIYHAAEKEVVGNVFSMFENQFKDQIQKDITSSGGSGGDQFKCFSDVEKILKERKANTCPRTEHCKDHCTCFKFPGELVDQPETNLDSTSDEEEEQEDDDISSKIFEIPPDAPEKIKRLLEMGFPGCPMFRQTPQMESLTRSGQVTYPGQIPLSQILGFPVEQRETVETGELKKMAEIMRMGDEMKRAKASKNPDNPQKAKASKNSDTERRSEVLKKEIVKRTEAAQKEPKKGKIEKPESPKTTDTKTKTSEHPSIVDSKKKSGEGDGGKLERDPVEYCSHLQSEVKRTQQKVAIQKIEEEMTSEQKEHEQEIQRTQLESIFKLMQEQEEKFGVDSMEDIQSQMKLYM